MAEDKATEPTEAKSAEPSPVPSGGTNGKSDEFFDTIGRYLAPGRENVTLVYALYLLGLVPAFGVVPIVVGFVMALINREKAEPLERSHYEYQFRQALIGLAFVVVSAVLIIVLIGFLGLLLTAIWWIVRSVKGLIAIHDRRPIDDPTTWTW